MRLRDLKKVFLIFILLSDFLYASDCEDLYFGIGKNQDFEAARQCFEKSDDSTAVPFLILIYLNGDGVKRSTLKALKIWKEATAKSQLVDVTMEELKKHIDDQINHPNQKFSRIEYCDIAMTTLDMNNCLAIKNSLEDQEYEKKKKILISNFSEEQKSLFNKIESSLDRMKQNDSDRIYTMYIDGSIRNAAFLSMEKYINDRHRLRVKNWIGDKNLPRYSKEQFEDADKKLNEAYKKARDKSRAGFDEMTHMFLDEKEYVQKYDSYKKEVDDYFIKAQLEWIKYRDTWAELMKTLFKDIPEEEIINSVETILTLERIDELKYDPVGPDEP